MSVDTIKCKSTGKLLRCSSGKISRTCCGPTCASCHTRMLFRFDGLPTVAYLNDTGSSTVNKPGGAGCTYSNSLFTLSNIGPSWLLVGEYDGPFGEGWLHWQITATIPADGACVPVGTAFTCTETVTGAVGTVTFTNGPF